MTIRAVVFDVGETLVDETRIYERWADRFGVPRLAFMATVGTALNAGYSLRDAFAVVRPGVDIEAEVRAWLAEDPDGTGFDEADLYADVRRCLGGLRGLGFGVYIAGNQPSRARTTLQRMELPVDGIDVSEDWGAAKPDPRFFDLVVDAVGCPAEEIVYVGDRVDNDIVPARAAGMRAALVRRGPHGYWHSRWPQAEQADAVVDDLDALCTWVRGLA